MSTNRDLTRWNRAGLRRFRYVQGNAADFLDLLRKELQERLSVWSALEIGNQNNGPVVEGLRVLKQYDAERRDYAWEIARSFARACHVLGEHINAFANEGFLETATQWDSLRRLVEMLGYHPAPPASAATVLVLSAKPGAIGSVAAGFQVKYSPLNGAAPVVFETLSELTVDDRLNELRLARWNRSEQSFTPAKIGTDSPWRKTPEMDLSVGQPALLMQHPDADPPRDAPEVLADIRVADIKHVDRVSGAVEIEGELGNAWLRGYTQLLVTPKKVYRPHLNGPGLVHLDRPHGLAAGEVIAWQINGSWKFNDVTAVDGDALQIQDSSTAPVGKVYRAAALSPVADPTPEFRAPLTLQAAAYRSSSTGIPVGLSLTNDFETVAQNGTPVYYRLKSDIPAAGLYAVLPGAASIGSAIAVNANGGMYRFDGSPTGLESGAWMLAQYRDSAGQVERRPARIVRIEASDDGFLLELQDTSHALGDGIARDTLAALIEQLRRVEAILDQPSFARLRLEELISGAIGAKPISIIQGIGQRQATPASYADQLAAAGVVTVSDLATLSAARAISGLAEVRLREFRTRAEQLLELGAEIKAVGALPDTNLASIVALEKRDNAYRSTASKTLALEQLRGPFRYALRPLGHDRNALALALEMASSEPEKRGELTLTLSTKNLPPALKAGRLVVIEREDGAMVHQTTLASIETSGEQVRFKLTEPVPALGGFTLGNTIIYANTVRAGHGESKGERLLGSGNAALLNQEFVLEVAGIAFAADSTMPAGVRADIEVTIDAQHWQQVASLRDSRAADSHFTVRMTEEGYLRIAFGDGQNGRRLPSGSNNVRVRYRLGSGLGGNLPAGSLIKPVKPNALIAAVRQPLPAIGGNDLETVRSLRDSAPTSLLTLERAVTLNDYANLAASQSSVWQARAFRRTTSLGRNERIDVVFVPAGGAPLDTAFQPVILDAFLKQQSDFLLRHAPPGIGIDTRGFEPVLIDLRVTIRVKFAQYDLAGVIERVRAALWADFGLRRRRLGQALQRSQMFKIVEDISGVENSDCEVTLLSNAAITTHACRVVTNLVADREVVQTIVPFEYQVIYLDPQYSSVVVAAQEYVL